MDYPERLSAAARLHR